MARRYVCKLFKGVSSPIQIFFYPKFEERLTHPSKQEFLPISQSSKTQSFGGDWSKYSASVLFPIFLTPIIIRD